MYPSLARTFPPPALLPPIAAAACALAAVTWGPGSDER